MQVSGLAFSSTLKMKAIFSSEMSVDFQRTTRRYFPADRTPYNCRCQKLKSYRGWVCSMTFRSVSTNVLEWRPLARVRTVRSFPYSLLLSHSTMCAVPREDFPSWTCRQNVRPKKSSPTTNRQYITSQKTTILIPAWEPQILQISCYFSVTSLY
jgi:hypothetical protein